MQFALAQAIDGEKEVAAANFPQMHLFITPRKTSTTPKTIATGMGRLLT